MVRVRSLCPQHPSSENTVWWLVLCGPSLVMPPRYLARCPYAGVFKMRITLENAARFYGRSPDVRPDQSHPVFQLYLSLAAWPGTSHLKLSRSLLFIEWGHLYLWCRIVVSTKEKVPKLWLSYMYMCEYMYVCVYIHTLIHICIYTQKLYIYI